MMRTRPMTESSADRTSLGHVSLGQVTVLLRTLRDATHTDRQYISSRYAEHARFFADTMDIFETAGWVMQHNGNCTLTDQGREAATRMADARELSRLLVLATISRSGRHRDTCTDYLSKFQSNGSQLSYAPTGSASLDDGEGRDFLIAMGVVERHIAERRFDLTPLGTEVYLWATERQHTAETLSERAVAQIELGRIAELAVLDYEHRRLGPTFAHHLDHVAARWPTAPYDIRSVTIVDGTPQPRFIEVKAVSDTDWHFYWSSREVTVARLMRHSYFLYLVPCKGGPTIDALRVIEDPHTTVLAEPQVWTVEADILSCRLQPQYL